MSKGRKSSKTSAGNLHLSPGVTKAEKNKRAKYLSKRINSLFDTISDWTDFKKYSLKRKTVIIDGEKLPEMNILSGKKSFVSLKPAGLYAFGVNCRIDIISGNETNILFDTAEGSSGAEWQLISSEAGKKPKKFTKMIFRNLLKKLNM